MNSATGGLLNDDEGSCSDSALELFCTKVKIYKETFDTFEHLRNYTSSSELFYCLWLSENLVEDPQVPQGVVSSIAAKLFCSL